MKEEDVLRKKTNIMTITGGGEERSCENYAIRNAEEE